MIHSNHKESCYTDYGIGDKGGSEGGRERERERERERLFYYALESFGASVDWYIVV